MEPSAQDPQEVPLEGGGMNHVVRAGTTVRRPAHPWTVTVHALLRHLAREGFTGAPAAHGFDSQGREILDYLPGVVGNDPLPADLRGEPALLSAARLLRRYHDASASAVAELPTGWQLPPMQPVEVICHSDFAPYNCVFRGGVAAGIIDFDFARPGPRAWDLAYSLYRFAPLTHPENADGFGQLDEQAARARRFLDAYEATPAQRQQATDLLAPRLRALVAFMQGAAADGDTNMARNIAGGHLDLYLRDIEYLENSRELLQRVVVGG